MSILLSEHLPLLVTAPDGVQKLRNLILELAVRGKLVPQNPNDKSAAELVHRIAREREWLGQGEKCKTSKSISPVGEDEIPFPLPSGWVSTRIGALAEIRGGKRLPAGHSYSEEITPFIYIQVTNMKEGTILSKELKYITQETQKVIGKYTISKNDLYITIAGTIGDVGIVPAKFDGMNLTENAAKLSFSHLDHYCLRMLLSAPYIKKQFLNRANQQAQPKLALRNIADTVVALPPLAEQQRIATKVDELMAICDRLDAEKADIEAGHGTLVDTLLGTLTQSSDAAEFAVNWQRLTRHFDHLFTTEASLDALKQSILQLAIMGKLVPQDSSDEPASESLKRIAQEGTQLGAENSRKKPKSISPMADDEQAFEVPNGWEWLRFGNVWLSSFYGPRFGSDEYVTQDGVPTIRTTDMDDGVIKMKNPPMVRLSKAQLAQYGLRRGDILVTRSGSIGTMALYDSDEPAIPSAYLIRLRLSALVNARYVLHFLAAPIGQSLLGLNTTSVGVPNVSASKMADFPFPLPPLAEQNRIVAKVDELMALCDRLKAALAESRNRQARLASTLIETALEAA